MKINYRISTHDLKITNYNFFKNYKSIYTVFVYVTRNTSGDIKKWTHINFNTRIIYEDIWKLRNFLNISKNILGFFFLNIRGACKTDHEANSLATKSDNLSSIPRIHVTGSKNWLLSVLNSQDHLSSKLFLPYIVSPFTLSPHSPPTLFLVFSSPAEPSLALFAGLLCLSLLKGRTASCLPFLSAVYL